MSPQIVYTNERRKVVVPGDEAETVDYCVAHFIETARHSISEQGYFAVALSGGSTPHAIYRRLANDNRDALDWGKVMLFWSDERAVPPDSPESNYFNAMESGIKHLPIPKSQIHRMIAEDQIEKHAIEYEELIKTKIPQKRFDLMMLGMGEDGHTASLFPKTHGLHAEDRLIVANYLPGKELWRMSVTYRCINASKNTVVYVLGKNKATIVKTVFNGAYLPDEYPVQKVGTAESPALFIMDRAASTCFV